MTREALTFYTIYKAFQKLDKNGDPIDIVSVIEHVGRENLKGIGGRKYLTELMNASITTTKQAFYENLMIQYWKK